MPPMKDKNCNPLPYRLVITLSAKTLVVETARALLLPPRIISLSEDMDWWQRQTAHAMCT